MKFDIILNFSNFLRSWVLSRSVIGEETRRCQFITNNQASFNLWWKENLIKIKSFQNIMIMIVPQQTCSLFLGWLLIAQTQYRNMRRGSLQFTNVKKVSSDLFKKLALFKGYLFLKTRDLERIPYSIDGCSRLIFYKQLLKKYVFLLSL